MVFMFNGCGGSDPGPAIEEAPTSCTSSDECRGFCGVPSGTPVGTQDLVGTCDLDFGPDGCIVIVEQGEAEIEVCY